MYVADLSVSTGLWSGIPTDEEQATGLEKVIMTAAKTGAVRDYLKPILEALSRKHEPHQYHL